MSEILMRFWVSTCIFYELIFYVNDFMSQALQCWTKRRLGSLRPRSHWKENKLKENPESLPNMWSSLRLGYLLSSPSGRKREKINHMFDSGKFFVISSLVFQFLGGLIPTQIMDETAEPQETDVEDQDTKNFFSIFKFKKFRNSFIL